jgi:hypothetical protein
MRRRVWGAAAGAAVIGLGVAVFANTRPEPVPAVHGTMTVAVAGTADPAAARFLADVHRTLAEAGPDAAAGHAVVEVRVNWQVAAKQAPQGCDVNVVVVPDTFDVEQAMQYASLERHAQSLPGGRWNAGWVSTSGANVSYGSDGRVTPALRDAGVPAQEALGSSADQGHDNLVYVYQQLKTPAVPLNPARFRGWAVLQCDDRIGPVSALTVAVS